MDESYNTNQIIQILGVTSRQINYWEKIGLMIPSLQPARGSGSRRAYSYEDLIHIACIKTYIDIGVMPSSIKTHMATTNSLKLGDEEMGSYE